MVLRNETNYLDIYASSMPSIVAARYEIRFGRSFREMRKSFDEAILAKATFLDGPLVLNTAREEQLVDIRVPPHANLTTLIFGVKTFDDAGLHSELSNLVSGSLKPILIPGGAVNEGESKSQQQQTKGHHN